MQATFRRAIEIAVVNFGAILSAGIGLALTDGVLTTKQIGGSIALAAGAAIYSYARVRGIEIRAQGGP